MTKVIKNLIVGAGLSGAVLAERIANVLHEEVLVLERRDSIGGNCYDYLDTNNICIHKYGPHIFHTELEEVWQYLNRFSKFNDFEFKPNVVVNGKPVTLPFNLNTLHLVFNKAKADMLENKLVKNYGYNGKVTILDLKNETDKDLKELADFVYKNVYEGFSAKHWGLKIEEIDPSITARVPIIISHDDRYFHDKYQGIPVNGYTKMIENIFNQPLIEVRLNTDFESVKEEIQYERLFYTGAIDEFFNYTHGELLYRSLKFDVVEKDIEDFQGTAMVNYPNDFDFTRITEHKHFLKTKSSKTVISYEYPQAFELGKNERYYTVLTPKSLEVFNKYLESAKQLKNIYFLGRFGDYKYYNMDTTVDRALKLFEDIK